MHVPKIFEITDNTIIEQFIKENGFAKYTSGEVRPSKKFQSGDKKAGYSA